MLDHFGYDWKNETTHQPKDDTPNRVSVNIASSRDFPHTESLGLDGSQRYDTGTPVDANSASFVLQGYVEHDFSLMRVY